jgi:hypothetical protein
MYNDIQVHTHQQGALKIEAVTFPTVMVLTYYSAKLHTSEANTLENFQFISVYSASQEIPCMYSTRGGQHPSAIKLIHSAVYFSKTDKKYHLPPNSSPDIF